MRGHIFRGYLREALINVSAASRPNACFYILVAAPLLKVFRRPPIFLSAEKFGRTCFTEKFGPPELILLKNLDPKNLFHYKIWTPFDNLHVLSTWIGDKQQYNGRLQTPMIKPWYSGVNAGSQLVVHI